MSNATRFIPITLAATDIERRREILLAIVSHSWHLVWAERDGAKEWRLTHRLNEPRAVLEYDVDELHRLDLIDKWGELHMRRAIATPEGKRQVASWN